MGNIEQNRQPARRTARPWTTAEEEVLKTYTGVLPVDTIAEKLSRSRRAVQQKWQAAS